MDAGRPVRKNQTSEPPQTDEQKNPFGYEAIEQKQQQWIKDVVLFLNSKRPSVQQRLKFSWISEVATFAPEKKIGGEGSNANQALAEILEFVRKHPKPSKGNTSKRDCKEGW